MGDQQEKRKQSSSASFKRTEIQPHERAKRKEFMAARAHLAARVTGASIAQLKTEVEESRKNVNSWKNNPTPPVSEDQGTEVYEKTLNEDYATDQKRFQDLPEHNKPRIEPEKTGREQLREMMGDEYIDNVEDGKELAAEERRANRAFEGARHTRGHNDSSFVSLTSDPEKLRNTKDTGPKGAASIAKKTKELHTYTIPKQYTWNTERLDETIAKGHIHKDENINRQEYNLPLDGGDSPSSAEWLKSTPKEEGEVLFLGGDLDSYRTSVEENPNLRQSSSSKTNKKNKNKNKNKKN